MTQGLDLLSRIVDDNTLNAFRNIRPEWFIEGNEAMLYRFLSNYINQYGNLPSHDVLAQNGYILDHPDQPVNYYRDQVSDRYVLNAARTQYGTLLDAVRNYDVASVREASQNLNRALSVGNSEVIVSTLHDESVNAMERARQAFRNGGMFGYTCGYEVFDAEMGGHQRGDVDVYAGRPNTGKSYFLLRDSYVNWRNGARCMFISLEMTNIQMATRMLGLYSGMDARIFKTGTITTWGRRRLDNLIASMVCDTPYYFLSGYKKKSVEDILAAVDVVDPDIIYIDAGYLLTISESKYYKTRREQIAAVVERLKEIAMMTNKAFVISVQFNRNVFVAERGRGRKKEEINSDMDLGDIGETDVIGQQASNVIGIHPPKKDPISQRRRILQNIKAREGATLLKLEVNYRFDPTNLDPIGVIEYDNSYNTEGDLERRAEESVRNLAWMV